MPITRWCFIIAGAALAGLPFMSGFWSKDEILAGALNNGYPVVFAMGVITAFMTAAYTLRAYWLTFEGGYKGHAHPHESPKLITVPLMILAAMAFIVTALNIPNFGNWTPGSAFASVATRFEHYVQPTFAFPAPGPASAGDLPVVTFTIWLALASVVIALAGLAVMYLYVAKGAFKGLTEKVPVLGWGYRVLVEKYYLDYLYTDIIVGGIKRPIANFAYWTNMNLIDPIVWGTGVVARIVGGFVYRFIDQGIVDRIVNTSGLASNETGQFLRRGQTGKVQQYASLLFGSAVVFVICLVLAIR
jgi:NADH-quinone oxidoreductase subunit L